MQLCLHSFTTQNLEKKNRSFGKSFFTAYLIWGHDSRLIDLYHCLDKSGVKTTAMANNPGTERRFLDLNALVRYVQTMPKILIDLNNFQQSVNNDMNALVEKLNQLGNSTNWLETNFEQVATQVANLRADFDLFQGIRAPSPPQEEGWEFGNDGGHCQLVVQKGRFPGQMSRAQDPEMTTDPFEAQSYNAINEDAEDESDAEYSRQAEQLL